MKLRLTVYDAALDTATDASLGLYNGDLLWGYGYTESNYKAGFIDRTSFGGLTQSATNVTSGGTYSNGFTDVISVSVATSEIYAAWKASTITLQGRYVRLEVFFTTWTTVFYQRVTAVEPVSQFELRLLLNNTTALDTTKVPFTVVTREMALNSDSDAVGQEILPSYGNYVYYKMVFCETPNTIGAMVYRYQGASDSSLQLWTGSAPQLGTTDDTFELAVPDLSFMRGKSLLQCVGAWQTDVNSPVWIALSYNGKELLATINVNTREELMRRALIGKRLKGVHGNSKDASFLIIDVAWATHEVTWDTTDITTLWIQVDSVDINSFTYALPNWSAGALGNGTRSLHLNTLWNANSVINNILSVKRDDAFLNDVTYLSFEQPNAGIFIIPIEADIDDCTVYQKVDGYPGYLEVALPSGIEVIYTSERWKMLSIAMRAEFGTDSGDFQQSQPIEHDSYILENFDGTGFGHDLNVISAGMSTTHDGLAQSLTLLTPTGYTTTPHNYEVTGLIIQNTFYIPWSADLVSDKLSLRLVPDVDYTWGDVPITGYNATLTVDIYAIGENNIALSKKSHKLDLSFNGTAVSRQRIQVDTVNERIITSANCSSQELSSSTAYQRLAQALTFSSDELPLNKTQLNGFVVSVRTYQYFGAVAPLNTVTKVLKPVAISQTQKADKKNLWLRSRKDASVTTPLGIVLSIAQELGVPVDATSFIDAQIAQRAYFSTTPELFDGVYIPQSSESFSSIIDAIGKATLTAIYLDAVGVLHAKFLPTEPAGVSASFDVDSVKKNSDIYSMSKNGYLYTDYDFSILRNPLATAETVAIDTDSFTTFPAEEDTPLGSIVFSSGTGYTIEQMHYDGTTPTTWISAVIRSTNSALFALFVPGTIWSFTRFTQKLTCRLDSCSPDIGNALVTQDSIGLLFKILRVETITDIGVTLRTFGPNPDWRKAVSGALVDNYALSQAIWDYAKAAREIAGTEIKAPTEVTQLTQPIWGSDPVAITNWITETVKYGSTQKLIIKFSAVYDENTVTLQYMDFVSYNFGAFATAPINGLVIERSLDLEKSQVSYTLLCKGEGDTLPAIATELDESIVLEAGPLLEPENPTAGSTKISELSIATPQAAATAGAYTVVAITNVSNSRVALSAVKTWIYDDVMSATTALIATKANDGAVVHKSGDENIDGVKNFITAPTVPDGAWSTAKTSGLQIALDDKVSKTTATAQTIVSVVTVQSSDGSSILQTLSPDGTCNVRSSVDDVLAQLDVTKGTKTASVSVSASGSQIAVSGTRLITVNSESGISDSGLTAAQIVKTDAGKKLVSVASITQSEVTGLTTDLGNKLNTSATQQTKSGLLTLSAGATLGSGASSPDGEILATLNSSRAWFFESVGAAGGSQAMGFRTGGTGKSFHILSSDRTKAILTVNNGSDAPGTGAYVLATAFRASESAVLQHAGTTRIETTTTGAKVTGILETTSYIQAGASTKSQLTGETLGMQLGENLKVFGNLGGQTVPTFDGNGIGWNVGSGARDFDFITSVSSGAYASSFRWLRNVSGVLTEWMKLSAAGLDTTCPFTVTSGADNTIYAATGLSIAGNGVILGGASLALNSTSGSVTLRGLNLVVSATAILPNVPIQSASGVTLSLGSNASTQLTFNATGTLISCSTTFQATNAAKTTQTSATSTGAITWNLASGGILYLSAALTGAVTLNISNPVAGSKCELLYTQGTSRQVITLSSSGVIFRQTRSTVTGTGTMALTLDTVNNGFYRMTLEWITTTLCKVVIS